MTDFELLMQRLMDETYAEEKAMDELVIFTISVLRTAMPLAKRILEELKREDPQCFADGWTFAKHMEPFGPPHTREFRRQWQLDEEARDYASAAGHFDEYAKARFTEIMTFLKKQHT